MTKTRAKEISKELIECYEILRIDGMTKNNSIEEVAKILLSATKDKNDLKRT